MSNLRGWTDSDVTISYLEIRLGGLLKIYLLDRKPLKVVNLIEFPLPINFLRLSDAKNCLNLDSLFLVVG